MPALILIGIFILYPVIHTLLLGFFSSDGNFVGLDNYYNTLRSSDVVNLERFPSDSPPWGALIHNIVWIGIHLPLCVFLGMIIAVLLEDVKGASIIKSIVFIGMVLPLAIGGLLAEFMFDKDIGIINVLLRTIGFTSLADRSWIAWPDTALLATILSGVWLWTGFSMIVYSAALATIPKEYYEAAKIDRASSTQEFIYITLPMLKPATLVVIVMSVLYELKIFDVIFVATNGGPGGASSVLALLMYRLAFIALEPNQASVLASLLTILTLPAAIWIAKSAIKRR